MPFMTQFASESEAVRVKCVRQSYKAVHNPELEIAIMRLATFAGRYTNCYIFPS